MLIRVIGALLVLWLAFIVLGAVIHTLFVLAVIGALLFVGTAGYAAIKNRSRRRLP
jgi:hypothetical protein